MSAPMSDQPRPAQDLPVEGCAPVAPVSAANTGLLSRVIAGQPLRRWLLLAGAGVLAVWAVWATKMLVDLSRDRHTIVQVRLSDIVGDYVRDAARSSLPADEVSRQTARFLKVLHEVVSAQGSGGRIVLLSNAVVSGELPDITQEVRGQVYSRVSRPIAASPPPVSGDVAGEMRAYIGGENASAATGASHAEQP